ncbi:carbon-nitrogen hydrolase family protein [Acidiferrobacter sp.]|uniref:carbon-nitrogen hydrolase family protein n=1 Tax=Acidiferrobacter sp. TaxID=1872107 RepID=UPI00260F67D7|nr:carbon-nitrogen hydrolase family protein [Acidiferrobacter sp.]
MTAIAAAVQMGSGRDVAANLALAQAALREAHGQGAKLAVLPENFALMADSQELRLRHAETDEGGPMQEAISGACRTLGMWVVAGTIPMRSRDPARLRAACLVFNDHGERVARYDKIHLFDVDLGPGERYAESDGFEAGPAAVTVPTPWGRLGLAICYDLRFPELFRALLDGGAEMVALPAAFTVPTGQAHWEVLVRARAIENSSYIIAAAQSGRHDNGRTTYGHSLIVDPWGAILAERPEGPGIAMARIDQATLAAVRRRLPSVMHRRLL